MLGRELGKVFPVSVPVGPPAVERVDFYIVPDVPDVVAGQIARSLLERMGFTTYTVSTCRTKGLSTVLCAIWRDHAY